MMRGLLGAPFNLFLVVVTYFWIVWGVKFVISRFYKPIREEFVPSPISVIIPTYHEEEKVLFEAIRRVLQYPPRTVSELLIVVDEREAHIAERIRNTWRDSRLNAIVAPRGKRPAIEKGIRAARNEVVVIVESDTFVDERTILELVKPFADKRVGGVVGDQRVYRPHESLANLMNALAEGVKYKLTIPALSVFGQVPVLGGRCVAYRKKAVEPLLPDLINERFLGKRCIAGDDGRLTSLLLRAGWRALYQSTAVSYTLSPPTWAKLVQQKLRWFRNSCRRTLRALFWDGCWVWRKPAALLQMLSTWTNTFMMALLIFCVAMSIYHAHWFWFGTTYGGILARAGLVALGISLTRLVRVSPALRDHPVSKWAYVPIFSFYLIGMWLVRLYAILTMNKQGWITRKVSGPGGF